MTSEHLLALLGMSSVGKTTYLGRLWLGVHKKVGRLHSAGLPEKLRPLRDMSSHLLKNEYPPRTRRGEVTSLSVKLRWAGRNETLPFTLSFSDYSGEELERIFTDRDAGWTDAWQARATGSVGLLLFLRPKDIRRPMSARLQEPPDEEHDAAHWFNLKGDAPSTSHALSRDDANGLSTDDASALFDKAFLPQNPDEKALSADPNERVHPPTAVALVEVLQFLRHERGLALGEMPEPEHFRVAVAVSCWDAVPTDWREKGPEPFIQQHFPLLHDFLLANFHQDGVRFFGVSSTGGDLTDKAFQRVYQDAEPDQMGELVYHPSPTGSPKSVKDISLPIGWLLEGESALPESP